MKKIFRKEVVIGITVISAMAILIFGINFLKGVNLFKAANYYTATYTNVAGLSVSAPVRVNGFKIGLVREINYEYDNPGHIQVEISLDKNFKVPYGTQAVIVSDLLGTASIELRMGTGPDFHGVGDELQGVVVPAMMENVSNTLLPSVGSIMPKIDSLLTALNTIVGNPALLASVQRLDAISSNLEAASAQLSAVMKTMPAISADVKKVTCNLASSADDINMLTGRLKDVPVDTLANNLAVISANLKELTEQLNDKNSTIGKLTHDPQLYNSLNAAVSNLDSLFIDIKMNPKRYVTFKVF